MTSIVQLRVRLKCNFLTVFGELVATHENSVCAIGVSELTRRCAPLQRRQVQRVLLNAEAWGLIAMSPVVPGQSPREIRITPDGWAFRRQCLEVLFPETRAA